MGSLPNLWHAFLSVILKVVTVWEMWQYSVLGLSICKITPFSALSPILRGKEQVFFSVTTFCAFLNDELKCSLSKTCHDAGALLLAA